MKKVLFAAVIALAGMSLMSCSKDSDETPSWYVEKNLAKQDIAGHTYTNSRITIHVTPSGSSMQVWRNDNSGGVGSNDFIIDGDSIRFTARKVAFRARLIRYGEGKPLSLVLSNEKFGDDDFLPGGLKPGIYDEEE